MHIRPGIGTAEAVPYTDEVRSARRRGTAVPRFPVEACRRINSAEVHLVVLIVFVAAFMARDAWLF